MGTTRGSGIILVLTFLASLLQAPAAPQPPLTRAIDIRSLSASEAEKGLEVRLPAAAVTFIGQPGSSVFVQDETAGTFFRPTNSGSLQLGDIVEVVGRTRMGSYLPGIDVAEWRIVGRAPLPSARAVGYDDLESGLYHYQRVAIEGIARAQSELPQKRGLLRVALGNRIVEVHIETGPHMERVLVDSRVRVEGLAAGSINNRRQMLQPILRIGDWAAIIVLEPGVPESSVPPISASELLTFRVTGQGNRRIRIGGLVTAVAPKGLVFVRNERVAFGIQFFPSATVEVGDRIELLGFSHLDRFSASVVDATLVARQPGPQPTPTELDIAELLQGVHDCDLVAVTAVVTDSFRVAGDVILTLQDAKRAIQARVPAPGVDIAVGSLVRVVGTCQIESSVMAGYNVRPETVSLRMRSASDVAVLRFPPWWTIRRAGVILAVLSAIVLLAVLWITALRRQVTRQTAALSHSIESEAALQERQRIAREFHDTLDQELVGLGLRLDAASKLAVEDKSRGLIQACRTLVSRIQIETRNLLSDLRSSSEQAGDLVVVLHDLANRSADRSATEVSLRVASRPPRLPATIVHHLGMIAGECVANALKHSGATSIEIAVSATADQLVMAVTDDGHGFNTASETQGKAGHFGCIGIRERCRKVGAEVAWSSEMGMGVTVTICLPLNPPDAASDRKQSVHPLQSS